MSPVRAEGSPEYSSLLQPEGAPLSLTLCFCITQGRSLAFPGPGETASPSAAGRENRRLGSPVPDLQVRLPSSHL